MPPAVSVITPCYNAAGTLARAVASVQAQSFADWEMIVSDDGSTDGSAALAERLAAGEPRLRLLRWPGNSGAARARNRAIAAARGRYIAFLDADDEWLPEKLKRQIAFMQAEDVALCYTGFYRVRGGRRHAVRVPAAVDYDGLLRGNVIGCLTAVYDSAIYGRAEMPDIRMRQDYGLWLQLLRRSGPARAVTAPLAVYHMRAGSLSSDRLRGIAATWRLYREIEGLPRHRAAACLASHLWRRLRS